ncbi:MAG TPA: aspartyl protease family protein [Lacunisphaera sp.]
MTRLALSSHVLLLALALGLTGCFTVQRPADYYRPRRTTLAADRVELPTTSLDEYLLIETRINGAGPFRLLVDSGCSSLVLSPRAAKLAHVRANPFLTEYVSVIGGKGLVKQSTAQVDRLEAGGLTLEGVKALVSGKTAWAEELIIHQMAFGEVESFDGVLGMSVLYDVILEMDYPTRQVAVVRPGTGQLPADRAVPYNLDIGVGWVTLEIGGKPVRALIDTGFNGGFKITSWEDIPLLYPQQKEDGLGAYGAGGQVRRRAWGQLEGEMRLGPITWQNAIGVSNDGKEAVVGSLALKPWKVVFDQHAHQLYLLGEHALVALKKVPAPDVRFKPGYFCELHGDGIRLLEVDAGGTFEQAGLRVGDVISTVDGFKAVDWVAARVPSEVLKKPSVKLNVERDGKRFETTLVQGPDAP